MIAYIDSSVALRMILGQPGRLKEWGKIVVGIASGLLEVECLRTIDRLRASNALSAEQAQVRNEAVYRLLEGLELVDLSAAVLHRAAQPMPAPLGTLDAIHLATAELWREVNQKDLLMATHDSQLAQAARATGMRTIGI
jgi:predicted nucleic acid-binding protein